MLGFIKWLFGFDDSEKRSEELRAKLLEADKGIKRSMEIQKEKDRKEKAKLQRKVVAARKLVKKKKLKRVYRTVDGSKQACYVDRSGDIVTYAVLGYLLLGHDDSPSKIENYDNYVHSVDSSHDDYNDNSNDSSDSSYDSGDSGGDSGGSDGGGGGGD